MSQYEPQQNKFKTDYSEIQKNQICDIQCIKYTVFSKHIHTQENSTLVQSILH